MPLRVFTGAPDALRDLLLGTERFGERDFLVYAGSGDERWTFREHLDTALALAAHLHSELGVGKGDRVAIAMRNYPEWILAFWATQALGAVAVPLNVRWTGPELRYALDDSGARVAFLDGERWTRLAGRLEDLPLRTAVVTRHEGALPAGVLSWDDLRARLDVAVTLPEIAIGPDDDATILYTSGTTGHPEGAVMSQRNHLTNYMTMKMLGSLGASDGPPPRTLLTYPLFHISGLMIMYTYTAFGGALALQYRWDVDEALAIMERERVLALTAVPTILRQLVESPRLAERDLSGLRSVATGAAPVPPDLIVAVATAFGRPVPATNGYGLTETTGGVAVISGEECQRVPTSVGRPLVMGEEVVAVVRPSGEASALDVEALRAHVAERLAAFKVPSAIVLRDEPLPRTATGKVLKRRLRTELFSSPGSAP